MHLNPCRISEAHEVHGRIRRDDVQRMLVKELVDCRNKAEAMVAIAEESHGNTKELYTQLAASFEHSARLIEEIKRSVP
jgi:hypothetical protein